MRSGRREEHPVFDVSGSAVWREDSYKVVLPRGGQLKGGDVRTTPLYYVDFVDGREIHTIWELIENNVKVIGDREFLGERENIDSPFVWKSYATCFDLALCLGRGILALPQFCRKKTVGFLSINRAAFWIMAIGCQSQSIPFIGLYDAWKSDVLSFVVENGDIAVLFVSRDFFDRIPDDLRGRVAIVVLDDHEWSESDFGEKKGEMACEYVLSEVIEMGKKPENAAEVVPPSPDDLFSIVYSSGTTGNPKGVMISHRNMVAQVIGMSERIPPTIRDPSNMHSYLSFLPYAHVLSLSVELTVMRAKGRVGYYRGDKLTVVDDIAALQPTIFCGVPRLYQRLYDRIMGKVEEGGVIKRSVFASAVRWRKYWIQRGSDSAVAAKMLSKVKAAMGGRILLMVSTSAPLAVDYCWFARCVLCDCFMEGWGMTEVAGGGCTQQAPYNTSWFGHIGLPFVTCEMKLISVPELGYSVDDKPFPRGELCVRGPMVTRGYYKNPELTAEVIDEDGWLHSGDIGMWGKRKGAAGLKDGDGFLQIIDRKKSLIKLAQGEYISPELVEGVLGQIRVINQIWVHGSSLEKWLICVVVPDEEVLRSFYAGSGDSKVGERKFDEICAGKEAAEYVQKEIFKRAREAGLRSLDIPRGVILHSSEFDSARDLVTPAFKLKRKQLRSLFQKDIDELYKRLNSE